jgi:hydroxymethylglutaryl-CoA reductase (NADPH)
MLDQRTKKILEYSFHQPKKILLHSQQYNDIAQKNCENIIGAIEIPVGLAGPLLLDGQYAKGEFCIPLATTEGCLVASINRGIKALRSNVTVDIHCHVSHPNTKPNAAKSLLPNNMINTSLIIHVERVGITRSPVFEASSVSEANDFAIWLQDPIRGVEMQEIISEQSRYLELMSFEVAVVDKEIFILFRFDPKDAMGMNMVTSAVAHLVKYYFAIHFPNVVCLAVSSNWCSDKKPSRLSQDGGRGIRGEAKAFISHEVLETVLKTNAKALLKVYKSKLQTGSKLAGIYGQNSHIANIVAALFLATGQDPAHVVEGSLSTTQLEIHEEGVEISLVMPSIVCGTIGGGTHLPTPKNGLAMLGLMPDVDNPGHSSLAFAEIIMATVLAGELSLLAALSAGHLARAHDQKRGK